ncbi:glycosyltransferase [Tenacibaculum maritimum]|uniref:Glycosyltransferase, family GT2 n=2 Tax=Tenacibaculum maritimum TaxID=107401 RepID=A0A2H1EA58_9FLAO|nr:glycosyltransferase [Tenacibaculum maritimum]CAA0173027.1 Glycosyltransferase, family GT2 [Tenacibaculum maritimum]CAA0184797.1 Glycosyltransferase, family GT2 [Tenacibaculum maritimum]CAA0187093.1 Glycosyltransferase, family GT2 [Tenacibaculum maritimum]CAA0190495.1 Glycosyltransferase, family GT2 [Tenacibaculum maritimum]CAA0237621.1 Glycosyltransferase, family GT2 [Tenacibaculum maritimum]
MMNLSFSIVIPVYNRPQEIDELLGSLIKQNFHDDFEIVIVEDGSTEKCDLIVEKYKSKLCIRYFFKENSGAGESRNFGMNKAKGNYFIILDSDVLVPTQYLQEVKKNLRENYTDAFGGPDAAHSDFTPLQKAINYSMTSVLTTGGIRGKKKAIGKFQPRSFNLGISKKAFEKTKGFSKMKVGEDIDLTFRLWKNDFETQLIEKAFVFHKRRSTIGQFLKQTFSFGAARPILNKKYPTTAKLTYWFPSLFILFLCIGILLSFLGYWEFLIFYGLYFIAIFVDSLIQNKKLNVAALSILTTSVQFLGYGTGFIKSSIQ